MSNDNLVPEPQPSVFDAVNGVLQDEEAARRVMANPALAKGFPNGRPRSSTLLRPAMTPVRVAVTTANAVARMTNSPMAARFRSRRLTISAAPLPKTCARHCIR